MIFDEGVNVEGLFDNANQATLQKALEAGYGTDASQFTDGRALQPEDLESTLVNVLDVLQDDCKVFNSIYRQPSKSTVHQLAMMNSTSSAKVRKSAKVTKTSSVKSSNRSTSVLSDALQSRLNSLKAWKICTTQKKSLVQCVS